MLLASFAKQSELGRVLITKATTTTKHEQARLISVKRVYLYHGKGKVRLVSLRSVITRNGPLIKPELIPVFESCIDKEYFHSSLDSSPSQGYFLFAGTQLYTRVERGTVRVKCLAQEHNTMNPTRSRTQTARSGVQRGSTIRSPYLHNEKPKHTHLHQCFHRTSLYTTLLPPQYKTEPVKEPNLF